MDEKSQKIRIRQGTHPDEIKRREALLSAFKGTSIPEGEILSQLGMFLSRRTLSRIFLMDDLYRKIIHVPGIIIDFGTRWGQNAALFSNFRGMYEPYNYNRLVVAFDTFAGFPAIDPKDGNALGVGDYAVTEGYEKELDGILSCHEAEYPYNHRKKFELIKGDALQTFPDYLKKNPHTVIALAYFDFDLYAPTKACLELVKERVTKGSIIAFDELNCAEFPGETLAAMEILGLAKVTLRRDPLNPLTAYMVVGDT